MSKKAKGAGRRKGRRLDFTDRIIIEACILDRRTLGQIASRLRVHKSTVLREIARGSTIVEGARIPCSGKWLGTCNRCRKKAHCGLERAFYRGKDAQLLSDVRRARRPSTRLSPEALAMVYEAISEGVRLGQSIHHVYASTPALRAICCERTVRRLVYAGLLSAKPHELRRYATFPRKGPERPSRVRLRDIRVLVGRTYSDFLERREARPGECLVKPGSVIGKASDTRAILTITLPKYGFQFARIVGKGQPGDVVAALRGIFRRLPPGLAEKAFAVVLADNGTEFSWLDRIEGGEDGSQARSVFFATPYRATDKAECERLHGLLRYCIPKGRSLDRLDQQQVDAMYSNINSYVRGSKGDRTPYELVLRRFGKAFLDAIGIRRVPRKKVRLLPIT